jgi:adenine-specific DNA-methyltransferase
LYQYYKMIMDGTSLDPAMDKIEQLKKILPEVFTEGKIDMEKMKATLGEKIEFANERYVLNWAGKSDAFRTLQAPTTATLVPDRDESVDFDNTDNIFIEGENLEVLKVLQKSYYNKVKMIYIDPPYNTGNDNFIYPDKFSESKAEYLKRIGDKDEEGFLMKEGLFRKNSKDSGHYHSNWLSMMYPRLFLARNLLKDDGVIFVSIDDNEVHNLRLLMNEIFGEDNFIDQVTRATGTPTGGGGARPIVNEIDYMLIYSKSQNLKFTGTTLTNEESAIYDKEDETGTYLIRPLRRTGGEDRREDRPTMFYPLNTPVGSKVYPIAPAGYESRWICGKDKYDELNSKNLIEWKSNSHGDWMVYQKFYLEGRLKQPGNLWTKVEGNQKETRVVRNLFEGKKIFDFPKPVGFINKALKISTDKSNDIILDFFSGSATTAHAVLDLNKEDGGNRKFIMVQLPEKTDEKSEAYKAGYKTIADIGKERIRRVIKKIEEEKKTKAEAQKNQIFQDEEQKKIDLGFKVFKLRPSNFKIWRSDLIETKEDLQTQITEFIDPVKPGSKEENMLFELLIKSGKDLNCEIVRKESGDSHYYLTDNEVAIALDAINQKMITEIISLKPNKLICLDRLFEDNDQLKTNTALQLKDAGVEFKSV